MVHTKKRKMSKRSRTNGGQNGSRKTRSVPQAQNRFRNVNVRSGGFLGIESKFVDYEQFEKAFTLKWAGGEMNPSTPACISSVLQGDAENSRDGRKYTITSVHIRGEITYAVMESDTQPESDQIARVALVWDKQTNAAELNAEDVFLTHAGSLRDVYAMRNLQQSTRFQVLKDKRIRVPVAQTVQNEGAINLFAHGEVIVPFSMDVNFKTPLQITCKSSGATISSIVDNSLHVIGCATSTTLKLSYKSRIRYVG